MTLPPLVFAGLVFALVVTLSYALLVRWLPAAAAPLVRIAGAASAATGVWLLAS